MPTSSGVLKYRKAQYKLLCYNTDTIKKNPAYILYRQMSAVYWRFFLNVLAIVPMLMTLTTSFFLEAITMTK